MRTLPLTCQDPQKWREDFDQGHMPVLEFFTYLTGCARSADAASIIACVPAGHLPRYKEYILGMASLTDDSQLTTIGDADVFNLPEVRKIARELSAPTQA